MWIILAIISGFCAALLAIVVKLYLKNMDPLFVTFLFSIVAIVILLLIDFCTKKEHCSQFMTLTWKQWIPLLLAGVLNVLAFISYVSALKCGKASGVVAIDRLGILYVVVFSVIFLGEPFSVKSVVGAAMMIVGCVLLSI